MGLCSAHGRMFIAPLLLLVFGVHVDAQRYDGWYGSQESYEDYREYDYKETGDKPKESDAYELLKCSDFNGTPTECVPIDSCPQLNLSQKRQFCTLEPNIDGGFHYRGRGPYVCCPNYRPQPPKKSFNRPTVSPTLSSGNSKNTGSGTRRRFSTTNQPNNRATARPDVELIHRGGSDFDVTNDCGVLERDENGKLEARIRSSLERQQVLGAAIGGVSVSSAAESPWTVAIGEYTIAGTVEWFCGGSLLSRLSVLTAAHCTRRRRPDVVRVGEVDLRRDTRLGEGKGEEVRVVDVAVHPEYRSPSTYNDIAILTLQRPVDLRRSGGARTICLPPPSNSVPSRNSQSLYGGERAALTGWGHLFFGGDRSPILQEVTVTVFQNAECSRSYASPAIAAGVKRSYPSGIINSQLCAGDRNGKKDACQGDSGGPLVFRGKDKKHYVIGVISSGIGCGSKQYPGVYARVSSFTDWISSHIQN